jgi:hypothetical protein
MVSEAQPADGSYEGDPIGPGLFASLRRVSRTRKGRQVLILAVALLIVVAIVVFSFVHFSTLSHESQSYKNGYTAGGSVYAADGSAELAPRTACAKAELRGPHHGGLPSGANATQWLKGCVDAFELAQSGN